MKTLPLLLALGLLGAGCEAKLEVSSQPTKAKLAPYAPAPSSKAKDNKTNWWALGGFSAVLAAFLGWAFTREDQ